MRKILIVETGRLSKNSTIAHVRNSFMLRDILSGSFDVELVDLLTEFKDINQYDIILFSYAGMGCNFANIDRVINAQKSCRIGWITNEFELFANDYVKQKMDFIITNFEEHGIKKAHNYDDFLMVNLNTLIFDGVNEVSEKKYGCCYFGTYRKYREVYFQRYFKEDFILSTSKKNFKKFIDLDLDCKVTDKFNVIGGCETLNLFKSTLYIEDTKTHQCFNYMANRFYEALQCNTALFFDKSCINTINKDSYFIDDYFIIDSYHELMQKTNDLDMGKLIEHTHINAEIAKNERIAASNKLIDFFNGLELEGERQKGLF
tara:strand:+ start:1664 stop:2614 length:951 start_codon:yes stop_codon:yes gene_type:complete